MPSIDEHVDQFADYFLGECSQIASINNSHFQLTLYFTLIDALGRSRYPKGTSYDRLVRLIQRYSGWPYTDRINLSQLHLSLSRNNVTQGRLYEVVIKKLLRWQDGLVCHPKNEPEKAELESVATTAERPLLEQNTYSALLYPLRNLLVHEFRSPGYGMNFNNADDEPYCHSYINLPRQTVFPPRFLQRLCVGCISNLRAYFKARQIDPYTRYEFGSLWRAN